jgi:hypothetical protein
VRLLPADLALLGVDVGVTSLSRLYLTVILVATFVSQKVQAEVKSRFKFLLNLYYQTSNSGMQVYDSGHTEKLDVVAPMLFLEHQIDSETDISAHFVFDTWSAASDNKLDANTGASDRKELNRQSRKSGTISYRKEFTHWGWSSTLGLSKEYDYRSLNFGGSLTASFKEDNFTVALSPQLFLDQARNFSIEEEKTLGWQGRTIYSLDITASQLLTSSNIIQFGYTYIGMNGMLNKITNSVVVEDNVTDQFQRTGERLPSSRQRHALHSKLVHGFSDELAAHLSYRYYTDDWGVMAHTYELAPRASFFDDDALLVIPLRFYQQRGASFYRSSFATTELLMTSDSDLGRMDTFMVGGVYSHNVGNKRLYFLDLYDVEWSVGSYFYNRSNGLKGYILQSGMALQF